jgi:DNA-binding transcriptional MocR family regulator
VVVFCESRNFFRLPLKILGELRRSIRSIVHFWRHLGELDLEKLTEERKMSTMSSKLSTRVLETDTPVMVEMQALLRGRTNVLSLGQGIVYWQPPEEALEKVRGLIDEPATSNYGADEGLPELRAALLEKLKQENKLTNSSVMVTAGANQAYVNLVLTLCDPGDSVVMFVPYYFNAYMAFQMTGITDIVLGHSNPNTIHPDAGSPFLIPGCIAFIGHVIVGF